MAATLPPEAAFAECERLATTHYENFSVLSWFLPRDLRPHFSSVYAFCRHTDDLGDEGAVEREVRAPPVKNGGTANGSSLPPERGESAKTQFWTARGAAESAKTQFSQAVQAAGPQAPAAGATTPEERLALLDQWEHDLRRCYAPGETPEHPYLVALHETIQRFDLPPEPFLALIKANRMDQLVRRYPTYADLMHYCEHSANPVGRLVLMLYGYRDAERQRCSDAICTALQLTNFWQDVACDLRERGRIYLPLEDMARFGYSETALRRGECTPAFQSLMAYEIERARSLFSDGLPLLALLERLPRRAIALFALGGLNILAAIERQHYDVFSHRPTLSRRQKVWLMTRVALRPQ